MRTITKCNKSISALNFGRTLKIISCDIVRYLFTRIEYFYNFSWLQLCLCKPGNSVTWSIKASKRYISPAYVADPRFAVPARVAQAVPGALLNEAALQGKPSYFHAQENKPYLPRLLFSVPVQS